MYRKQDAWSRIHYTMSQLGAHGQFHVGHDASSEEGERKRSPAETEWVTPSKCSAAVREAGKQANASQPEKCCREKRELLFCILFHRCGFTLRTKGVVWSQAWTCFAAALLLCKGIVCCFFCPFLENKCWCRFGAFKLRF